RRATTASCCGRRGRCTGWGRSWTISRRSCEGPMAPGVRRSIAKQAAVSGTGLHTGARREATFLPARAGQGIVFRRVDLAGKPEVPARLSEVEAVERRTAIGKGE